MRRLLFVCLILFGTSIFSQPCDTIDLFKNSKYDKYSAKKFQRLLKNSKIKPASVYQIANYFRFKNDTIMKDWYLKYIERTQSAHEKDKNTKASRLYKIAMSYYYLKNYKSAESYFMKTIKVMPTLSCAYYYLAYSCLYLKKENDYEIYIRQYHESKTQ